MSAVFAGVNTSRTTLAEALLKQIRQPYPDERIATYRSVLQQVNSRSSRFFHRIALWQLLLFHEVPSQGLSNPHALQAACCPGAEVVGCRRGMLKLNPTESSV